MTYVDDDIREQFNTALGIAKRMETAFNDKPDPRTFRMWRDSQEIAVKWAREVRRNGAESSSDDELEALLAG